MLIKNGSLRYFWTPYNEVTIKNQLYDIFYQYKIIDLIVVDATHQYELFNHLKHYDINITFDITQKMVNKEILTNENGSLLIKDDTTRITMFDHVNGAVDVTIQWDKLKWV